MIIQLEKELVKLPGIKKSIDEMGASLWQRRLRERTTWVRMSNARSRLLGWY
jgi:hypothetical protein